MKSESQICENLYSRYLRKHGLQLPFIKKIVDDLIVDFCLPEKLESRRQDLKPNAYIRSGSIYALKRDELMIYNRRYGSDHSRPYVLEPYKAVNVDTRIDFLIAEALLSGKEL